MQASDVIRGAKELLFEKGWTQGHFADPDTGRICLLEAMCQASELIHTNASTYLWMALAEKTHQWTSPVGFNDNPHTTFNDVIDVLDHAEKLAEEAQE